MKFDNKDDPNDNNNTNNNDNNGNDNNIDDNNIDYNNNNKNNTNNATIPLRWVLHGELHDGCKEFFVGCKSSSQSPSQGKICHG